MNETLDGQLDWSLLAPLEAAGTAVLTLVEGFEQADLLRSRLTRSEAKRQILLLTDAAEHLPESVRSAIPEIDWVAWAETARKLQAGGPVEDEALWCAVSEQVPTTMLWFRVHQQPPS